MDYYYITIIFILKGGDAVVMTREGRRSYELYCGKLEVILSL
jgi:hypothetical protein